MFSLRTAALPSNTDCSRNSVRRLTRVGERAAANGVTVTWQIAGLVAPNTSEHFQSFASRYSSNGRRSLPLTVLKVGRRPWWSRQ